MHDINMYVFADPKRKILITGSVPTENLPLKSDETPKVKPRVLVEQDISSQVLHRNNRPASNIRRRLVCQVLKNRWRI